MSENKETVKTGWSSAQVYTLSVICLIVGATVGYLFQGSMAPPASAASIAAPAQPAAPNTTAGAQAGPIAPGATPDQITPDQLKRMTDKQVAPLLEVLNKNPKDTDTMMKVGTYYLAGRQFEDAAKYYAMAANVKPSADALTKLAAAQYYAGSSDKAIASLNKALQVDPKSPNALYNLGMMKWQVQGDVKGAIQCWETLVKLNPNLPQLEQVKTMIARAKQHEKLPPGTKTDKPAM